MTNPAPKNNLFHELLQILSSEGSQALPQIIRTLLNQSMLLERETALEAAPYERTSSRKGYANGFKPKTIHTPLGSICVDVPQVRGDIDFYPSALERHSRTEKALLLAMAQMYIQGVSARKVTEVLQSLCGLRVSSSQVSRAVAELDPQFHAWKNRPIGAHPYLLFDARFEKVRIDGSLRDCAVLIAIGINEDGHRTVLGASCALSEAEVHWRTFLESLQDRGLHGVRFIASDDHPGLRSAIKARFGSVTHQRCQFHLIKNAMDHVPKIAMRPQVVEELRAIFATQNRSDAELLLRRMVESYAKSAPLLATWLETNIPEGLNCFELPKAHQKRMRTTNMVERVNQELKRRTRIIRIFPNVDALLRIVIARLSEISDDWETGKVYLPMHPKPHLLAA
jgi:transposase-like protein